MKAQLFIGPTAGILTLIAVACSSTPTPPDQTVAEFCADWAKAKCQISTSCQFDPAVCTSFQTGACTQFAQAAQATGTRLYSQPNGKACIDALNGAFGGAPPSIAASVLASIDTTCGKAFVGSVASHAACATDFDCTGGLFCVQVPGQSSRICATVTYKNVNDFCADPGDLCQGNSFCASTPQGPQCVATATTMSPCSATLPCGPSDHCVAGTCQPRATLGQLCASSADCSSSAPYCDLYPSPIPPTTECTTGLSFARGSIDCNGIGGTDEPDANMVGPIVGADASVVDSSAPDAAAVDAGPSPADAASGG
jgi:hypothetical protein